MLNVCFLSGDISRTGGTERVLSIIANELSKKDDKFNIHILSITNESNSSYFTLNKNIKTERILKSKDVNFKKHYFQVVKGIRQYIKKNKIDIFFATGRITEEQYNELMDINKEEEPKAETNII